MSDDELPELIGPAPRPCKSCPYRTDVPAQVWHPDEYAKLPGYDLVTGRQPAGMFRCHQSSGNDPRARVCAGWAHVHSRNPSGHELLALRLAALAGRGGVAAPEVLQAVDQYSTDVPCFASGAEAARWGTTGPFTDASAAAAAAIVRRRPDTVRRR